jgi:putative hemolysin
MKKITIFLTFVLFLFITTACTTKEKAIEEDIFFEEDYIYDDDEYLFEDDEYLFDDDEYLFEDDEYLFDDDEYLFEDEDYLFEEEDFIFEETDEDIQLANPASEYCIEEGGTIEIRTAEDGSQTGYCIFPDGTECEEWAFFRGECFFE